MTIAQEQKGDKMTKGEWLKAHDMYMTHVRYEEEADDNWIELMQILFDKFDEIYEDSE